MRKSRLRHLGTQMTRGKQFTRPNVVVRDATSSSPAIITSCLKCSVWFRSERLFRRKRALMTCPSAPSNITLYHVLRFRTFATNRTIYHAYVYNYFGMSILWHVHSVKSLAHVSWCDTIYIKITKSTENHHSFRMR